MSLYFQEPTYLINDNKLVEFMSQYDWKDIKKYFFNPIPVDLQPLKDQVATLITIIEEQLAFFNARNLEALEKSQKYLMAIVTAGSTEHLRRQHVKLRHEASEEEIKHCIGIPEHGFLVKNVSASSKMILGTPGLGSCLGLIIFNKKSKTIGLAHLDDFTVDLYKTSLDDMFDQCRGSESAQNEVYIIGLDLYDGKISMDTGPLNATNITNVSRCLASSLYDYVDNRNDSILKGTHFSSQVSSGIAIASMSWSEATETVCELFSADIKYRGILNEHFDKHSKLISPPY